MIGMPFLAPVMRPFGIDLKRLLELELGALSVTVDALRFTGLRSSVTILDRHEVDVKRPLGLGEEGAAGENSHARDEGVNELDHGDRRSGVVVARVSGES